MTYVIRMRADKKPFDDPRVRNAIKLCLDREAILKATNRGFGAVAEDHHVAPIHPEYTPLPPIKRDVDKAKALLKEAGYATGIQITLSTMDTEPVPTMAQLVKDQCAPAGITVNIGMMPSNMYWDQWMDVDMGITSWAHRPLAVMTLSLAYRSGAGWNESHWSDKEFDSLLDQAEATLDVNERKKIVAKIEQIMQERGPIAQPAWFSLIRANAKPVQNLRSAAHDHLMAYETWLNK
jgi:peptide/nickel transport system substrate-binding protein